MTRIDICICTFKRSHLARTLASLEAMSRPDNVELRIIVADNDETQSARALVKSAQSSIPIDYHHAPARNISIARNACLADASGDWIAFIDDDEIAAQDWLVALLARARSTGADAVFGPAIAVYAPDAPDWMVSGDYHSNIPQVRDGEVLTGHTCNALVKWAGMPWQAERFDVKLGKTGGEDTAFFFNLHRLGATFEIAMDAHVHEDVPHARQSYKWLWSRKFRSGQSYVASTTTFKERAILGLKASVKATASALAAGVHLRNAEKRNFWSLRSALHLGVVAGCLSLRARAHYGQ